VHYSTLIRLRECRRCRLLWSDARLAPEVVEGDFEHTYRAEGEDYFSSQRVPVFRYLADLICRRVRRGGRVLDVGGAQGHLMNLVRAARPDLETWVHDISRSATSFASRHFGLPAICGDFNSLRAAGRTYDAVVLSDVLYYEADLDGSGAPSRYS
jgi:2-polyprenyl-3-methyl-5-hydroxy-6-metoxy-1,4-benzoquinol methylase